MSLLLSPGTTAAYDRYVRELTQAFLRREWIYDPNYAAARDSEIYQKILRDPVFEHVISYRKRLVAGRDWTIEPASDSPEDKKLAEILEQLIQEIHGFTEARFNLAESIFRGSAYAFVEGRRVRRRIAGLPEISWWVPTRLVDVDRRRFRLARDRPDEPPCWELWSVARERWEKLGEAEGYFVRSIYQKTEDTLGYGRGLLDSLFFYAAAKTRLLQEGLSAAERFGQGFIKVAIDEIRSDPNGSPVGSGEDIDSVATAYIDELKRHRAENFLVHSKNDEIEVVTGFGEGWQLIQELIFYIDSSVRSSVLGANLTSSATGGGSLALAEEQANTTDSMTQFDQEKQGEDIDRDLVGQVYRQNVHTIRGLGLGHARPGRFLLTREKLTDPETSARVIGMLSGAGVPLRKDEVYRKTGFTVPHPSDEVIAPIGGAPGLDDMPIGQPQGASPTLQPPRAPGVAPGGTGPANPLARGSAPMVRR